MTRVLVVAGSAVVRAGLAALLAADPLLEVIGASAGGSQLTAELDAARPDVLLLELEPHDEDVAAAIRSSGIGGIDVAAVVLADAPSERWALNALRAGVRALLPRDASAEEIVAAVRAVATGLVVLDPTAVEQLIAARTPVARGAGASGATTPTLTPREIEVLNMLAEGLGNKQIAPRLGISEHTVKFHIASIFAKLHASTRTEAVTAAARMGIVML